MTEPDDDEAILLGEVIRPVVRRRRRWERHALHLHVMRRRANESQQWDRMLTVCTVYVEGDLVEEAMSLRRGDHVILRGELLGHGTGGEPPCDHQRVSAQSIERVAPRGRSKA